MQPECKTKPQIPERGKDHSSFAPSATEKKKKKE